jgi:hypothetical protein
LITCVLAIAPANGQKFRYFGTNLTDWATLTSPTAGGQLRWRILKNDPAQSGAFVDIPFGLTSDDLPNQGNWLGDAAHDLAVYRSSNNTYYFNEVSSGATNIVTWGSAPTDFAGAEGDYDGDHKMDYTIVRAPTPTSTLEWWVLRSSDNTLRVFAFGNNASDIALPGADYTGDGTDDPCVVRIGAGGQTAWIWGSTNGIQLGQVFWGNFNTDFVIPGGDYDGDGKADFMVWRGLSDGIWYLLTSTGNTSYIPWGIPGSSNRDRALRAGDYDGDGKTDIAIYRQSTMTYWVNRSSGGIQTQVWGVAGNTNLPAAAYGIY